MAAPAAKKARISADDSAFHFGFSYESGMMPEGPGFKFREELAATAVSDRDARLRRARMCSRERWHSRSAA